VSPLPAFVVTVSVCFSASQSLAALQMRLVTHLYRSARAMSNVDYHPIADADRDGLLEMAYATGRHDSMSTDPQRWEYGRFQPWNRWQLLHADTIVFPPPNGIFNGYFIPGAIGDADRDGLSEILGYNYVFEDTLNQTIMTTMEQQTPEGIPDTMTFQYVVTSYGQLLLPAYLPGDLDLDGFADIPNGTAFEATERIMLENRGNNTYVKAWSSSDSGLLSAVASGDFDLDGRVELAQTIRGHVTVSKAMSNDRYEVVWTDTLLIPNSHLDCFSARDANQNGRPEFLFMGARYESMGWMCYLYMWELEGTDYVRTLVDSVFVYEANAFGRSVSGDVDGDGVDEVIWNTNSGVGIYKASPGGTPQRVAYWYNNHDPDHQFGVNVNVADVNYDGYNEILTSCREQLSVLEVEAIRVMEPNRRVEYNPGDTCRISWQTFDPPHCDSVSLFLRTDTTYELDTIAHGLAPDDTPYVWVVPDIRAESAYVMAIAYGPGWQYDESDSAIRILGTGIGEERPLRIRELRLAVGPNPATGAVGICYDLPASMPVEVSVLDLSGRRVATLASGRLGPGRYQARWNHADSRSLPAGVYFVRLAAGGNSRLVKLVLAREER